MSMSKGGCFFKMSVEYLPSKFFKENCRHNPANEPFYGVIEVTTGNGNAEACMREALENGEKGDVGVQGKQTNIRRLSSCSIIDTEVSYTSKVIMEAVSELNLMFNYELASIQEILYCEYTVGDHYKMHVDVGEGYHANRKLSLTWNLNPDEYEGGELCFYQPHLEGGVAKYKSPNNNIIGFTSWLNHEVKPVTFGTRKSIVAFIGGKAWK